MTGMTMRQLREEFGDPGDDGTSPNSMRRQREQAEQAEAQRDREEAWAPLATQSDAHREWHRNSGSPMGTPGCPQDACHPVDDPSDYGFPTEVDSLWPGAVRCGNTESPFSVRDPNTGRMIPHYHVGTTAVRECYAAGGRFTQQKVAAPSAPAPSAPKSSEPSSKGGEDVAERVLGARWSAIPVGGSGFGYYALKDGETIRFFRVERPAEGKWAGKTFIKEQASDAFYPVEPKQRGYTYLTQIASDPEAAGRLYAETLQKCTRCNRTLTLTESRERGMGSDCWSMSGGW